MSAENLASRPRKTEKLWMYAALGLLVLFVVSIIKEYVEADWVVVSVAILAFAVMLYLSTRKERAWQYTDAIKACKELEFELTGTELDDSPDEAVVVEHGNRWRVHFRLPTPVTFGADPVRKVVVSREIKTPDNIIWRTDRSEALRTFTRNEVVKRQAAQVLEDAGVDTGEVEGDNEDA